MNRTVIITGASRGIGRELALSFAESGFNIAAVYFNSGQQAEELKKSAGLAGAKCEIFKCDVSDPVSVKKTVKSVIAAFKSIDILINNAGIARDRTVVNMSDGEWESVIRTNLSGPMYFIRECAPFMEKYGGSVINMASISGVKGNFGGANYAAAKAGLIALTKTAAGEFGPQGITVNAVLPGFHLTDMGKAIPEKYAEKIQNDSVLKTTTDVRELAEFVLLLSRMKTVSGQVFNWDSRII